MADRTSVRPKALLFSLPSVFYGILFLNTKCMEEGTYHVPFSAISPDRAAAA